MKNEKVFELTQVCIDSMTTKPDPSVVQSYLEQISHTLGYDYFLFGFSAPKNMNRSDHFILSNYPIKWRLKYDENQYIKKDPVISYSVKNASPILWNRLTKNLTCPDELKIMEEAATYGLSNGFSVPIHGILGEKGVLSFASKTNNVSKDIVNDMATASLLSLRLYDLIKQNPKIAGLHQPVITSQSGTNHLTEREKTCLMWVADGKSSWEISQILSCSERTINFHLQNAREKLNTYTRTQTVSQALLTGQISPTVDSPVKSY